MHFPSFVSQNDALLVNQSKPTTEGGGGGGEEETEKQEEFLQPGSSVYMHNLRHLYQLRIGQGILNAFYKHPTKLVAHHIDSYNEFIRYYLPHIFEQLSITQNHFLRLLFHPQSVCH
jgi:hypothetical protein